jgi:hypothetical protein
VIAHLGSGASLAAVRNGRCVDTTMGLTPLGGLMMSTRSGDVDPGALVHLMRQHALDADGLERLVEDEKSVGGRGHRGRQLFLDHHSNGRIVGGHCFHGLAAFDERQRPAPDEVDLEAEKVILGVGFG